MTFYFYDLETSGINPRQDRVMQFGGQRTDMNLKPVGPADSILIKLTDDILPQPDAVLTHGITPQKCRAEGVSEAQFLKYFMTNVFQADTIMVGFNNIRFDDEFMRFTLWRNFYDAYEWQWQDNCSRWDLLDVTRLTRALRPKGIKWPFDPVQGKSSNRLELLVTINKLDHGNVHDALGDVRASIALASLIRQRQGKLFDYLLNLRNKTKIEALVNKGDPVIYTSGRYPGEYQKTTIAVTVGSRADQPGAFMYDLRVDPGHYVNLEPAELAKKWSARGEGTPYFPVKILSYNKCPAIAPLSVLDDASAKRLQIDRTQIDKNYKKLSQAKDFAKRLNAALQIAYPPRQPELIVEQQVDDRLYDGFVSSTDKIKMSAVRATAPDQLANFDPGFSDDRLKLLLPIYKARNYPQTLSDEEKVWWAAFKAKRLLGGAQASQAAKYAKRLEELSKQAHLSQDQKYLLMELKLYGESILPSG